MCSSQSARQNIWHTPRRDTWFTKFWLLFAWMSAQQVGAQLANSIWGNSQAALTVMQCLGRRTLTRACHFENLYYDVESRRFVYFGIEGSTPDLFGEVPEAGHPWLRLMRGHTDWLMPEHNASQFHMDWRAGQEPPPAQDVVVYSRPLHLRAPLNPQSIGHLIRDNIQYMIDLPLRFGRDPTIFDWVRWESNLEWADWREEAPTAVKYRGLFNNRPSVTWHQVVTRALGTRRRAAKYILLLEVIAGMGPADFFSQIGELGLQASAHSIAQWAHFCAPFPFTAMRDIAYGNFGVQVQSVAQLHPFVLFLDGRPRERRHMVNAEALIPKLRETFPGVRMEHTQISDHSLEEQLQLLSKATVVVSNVGSRSFRLVYLPDGATVILVGPPEFEFPIHTSDPSQPVVYTHIELPFQEIDWCWGYIGYVNMLQYRVETREEVLQRGPWRSWKQLRNTDILFDEYKLTRLLTVALQKSQSERMNYARPSYQM